MGTQHGKKEEEEEGVFPLQTHSSVAMVAAVWLTEGVGFIQQVHIMEEHTTTTSSMCEHGWQY